MASWSDDNCDRATAPWHFINVELGLSFDEFSKEVAAKEDVYTALQREEVILADNSAPTEQWATALKYIVHFTGDIHQPMHLSRAEDKGGNTIQVSYDGQGTNLHSLWYTKLLKHGGQNPEQLAVKFDHATDAQIKKWQSNPQMLWAWESYQVSSQLYEEIEKNGTPSGPNGMISYWPLPTVSWAASCEPTATGSYPAMIAGSKNCTQS